MEECLPNRERDQPIFQTSSTNRLDHEIPMLNPVILKHIFQRCDIGTLKQCRLVSTLWRNVSLDSWRTTAVLKMTEAPFEKKDLKLKEYTDHVNRSRAEGDVNKLLQKPFRNYTLVGVKFFVEDDKAFQLFQGHFHAFPLGECVTRLHLAMCGFLSNVCFNRLLSLVPNLQELTLVKNVYLSYGHGDRSSLAVIKGVEMPKLTTLNLCLSTSDGYRNIDMSWEHFFGRFPNLQTLSVSYDSLSDNPRLRYDEFGKLLLAITAIRLNNKVNLRISSLDMLNVEEKGIEILPDFVLDQLGALDVKLSQLKLDVGTKTPQMTLRKFLEPHSSSLEQLTLFRLPSSSPLADFSKTLCGHQEMTCLRHLFINGSLVNTLGFLKWTPNLQWLRLFIDKTDYLPHKFPDNFRLRRTPARLQKDIVEETIAKYDMSFVQLSKLEDLEGDFLVSGSESFLLLTQWMPNVRSLHIPLTKDTFRVVCERWSHTLTKLIIPRWCGLDDEAITGFVPGDVRGCRGEGPLRPNITNLKGLTLFWMETTRELPFKHEEECKHTMAKLSDHSVLYGFIQLPHLVDLVITTFCPLLDSTVNMIKELRLRQCILFQGVDHCPCGTNRLVEKPREWTPPSRNTFRVLSYSRRELDTSFRRLAEIYGSQPVNRLGNSMYQNRMGAHILKEVMAFMLEVQRR